MKVTLKDCEHSITRLCGLKAAEEAMGRKDFKYWRFGYRARRTFEVEIDEDVTGEYEVWRNTGGLVVRLARIERF